MDLRAFWRAGIVECKLLVISGSQMLICEPMFELRNYSPRLHWGTKRPPRTSRAHLIIRTDVRSTEALLIQLGGNRFERFLPISQNPCDLFFPFRYHVL